MIKRVFTLMLCLCLLLIGCDGQSGKWSPEHASVEITRYAKRAIEVIDDYLNFELSSDEATVAFDELERRIKSLNVNDSDSEYSIPDKTVGHIISLMAIGDVDYRSDLDFMMYRDILLFQIGEKTSGKYYPAEISNTWDDDVADALGVFNMPIDFAHSFDHEGRYSLTLSFDYLNGVSAEDIHDYVNSVFQAAEQKGIPLEHLIVYYDCYDQPVFTLSMFIEETQCDGRIYNKNNGVIARFDSVNDLYGALESAEMYFGR